MPEACPDGTPTLTIDDPDNAGSEPGAWAEAIALTPGLAARVAEFQPPAEDTNVND